MYNRYTRTVKYLHETHLSAETQGINTDHVFSCFLYSLYTWEWHTLCSHTSCKHYFKLINNVTT